MDQGYAQFLAEDLDPGALGSPPTCGFIIKYWFGPFLLSPPSRLLRGRC
jgi:hypothetical protein